MDNSVGRRSGIILRSFALPLTCIAIGGMLAGCGKKDEDSKTAAPSAMGTAPGATNAAPGAAAPQAGSSAAIPKDPNDGAAVGPDGKPLGGGAPRP